eukprot:scaffold14879_cov122-Isochrysis_galbana.AAC.5
MDGCISLTVSGPPVPIPRSLLLVETAATMIIGGKAGKEETAVGLDDATKGCLPRGVLSSRALPGGPENPRPLRSVGPRTFPDSMLSQLTRSR